MIDKNSASCAYCGCSQTKHLSLIVNNLDAMGKKRGMCQKKDCKCTQFINNAEKVECACCGCKAVYHQDISEEGEKKVRIATK
jgi:hypothetical protein